MPHLFLTGCSSFTGCWFAEALVEAGYSVTGTFTRSGPEAYTGVDRERVGKILDRITPVWEAPFGSEKMLQALGEQAPDLLGLHAAQVGDHRAEDFDIIGATRATSQGMANVLNVFRSSGGKGVLHTASYFEADTGEGDEPREAFSPYAVCKGLAWQLVRFEAHRSGIPLTRFVILNPFGPLDKPGFTTYLLSTWAAGDCAQVRTPEYVRDNIPVDRLALKYAKACTELVDSPPSGWTWYEPSGYQERQGDFAKRFANEIRSRTGWACELDLLQQMDFSEPRVRINRGGLPSVKWDEGRFWDAVADEAMLRREKDVG